MLSIEEIAKGIQVNNVMMEIQYQVMDALLHVRLKISFIDQGALLIIQIYVLPELLALLLTLERQHEKFNVEMVRSILVKSEMMEILLLKMGDQLPVRLKPIILEVEEHLLLLMLALLVRQELLKIQLNLLELFNVEMDSDILLKNVMILMSTVEMDEVLCV